MECPNTTVPLNYDGDKLFFKGVIGTTLIFTDFLLPARDNANRWHNSFAAQLIMSNGQVS